MFDNNNNIFQFDYEVQLDNIVNAICDISFDIGKEIEEIIELSNERNGFTINDLFHETYLREISIRPDDLLDQPLENGEIKKGYTNNEFFSKIADHFNRNLFYTISFLDKLKMSNILFIDKKNSYYLSLGDIEKGRFFSALKNAKILKQIILNLKSDKIKNSLQKIDLFENEIFYRNTIKSNKLEGQPLLAFVHFSFINGDIIECTEVDVDDYWINDQLYNDKYGINLSGSDQYFLVCDKENKLELGLLINETIILYANIDVIKYINVDKILEYYWLLIKYTYGQKTQRLIQIADKNIDDFKELRIDNELNQLLSFLKNNLYISDEKIIKDKFLKFFNPVVLFDKLDHLGDYEFLMSSNSDEETALGIYSTVKIGSNYNLLHWINYNRTSKVNHFRSSIPKKLEKVNIYTLKPAICYYFLEKYFEDFFESILIANQYEYLSNFILLENKARLCEIDFFVKSEKAFYYIETKTKLSKLYIEDFLKKSSKMIEKFKAIFERGIDIKFILFGGYSDNDVEDYQYFIDKNKIINNNEYNIGRVNLKCKPYYFNVPIPDKEGAQIICIAEPEYDKLQELVLQLCPK